jgi:hypothetical protein
MHCYWSSENPLILPVFEQEKVQNPPFKGLMEEIKRRKRKNTENAAV